MSEMTMVGAINAALRHEIRVGELGPGGDVELEERGDPVGLTHVGLQGDPGRQ